MEAGSRIRRFRTVPKARTAVIAFSRPLDSYTTDVSTRRPETAWDQKGPTTIWKVEDTQIFNANFYLTGLYSKTNGGFQLIPDAGSRCQSLACAQAGPSTWFDINAVPHRSYVGYVTT